MAKETITFIRMATKKLDGKAGFLYHHSWGTGYQALIFETKEQAEGWIIVQNDSRRTPIINKK